MKIGIDARLWDESGVGRYIRNLVFGIDNRDVDDNYTVFLTSKNYDSVNFRNPKIKKTVSNARWHALSEQWKFKEESERQNLDLVHFPYFSYPVFYKKTFVVTIHDLIIDHFPTGVASSLPSPIYKLNHIGYKKIVASAVKNSKRIIVPSIATKDEIIDHYKADKEKIDVIYEGFDSMISKGKDTQKVSTNYILYVGNAYPHKNLPILLKAYSEIRDRAKIDLVCIGRNDFFYDRLEKDAPKGVKVLHNIDDQKLFDYYKGARFFVMPSLMEGFGLPVLEAMSLSCPIICSDTPALKEIAGQSVLYFDPNNVQDLVEKMNSVIENPKLTDAKVKIGLKTSQNFSWDKCVTKTLKVYESCNSLRPGQ